MSESGGCNLFQSGVMPGPHGVFQLFDEGEKAYNTDRNNFAPSIGVAWTIGGAACSGRSGRQAGDSVLRAGYTLAYDRPGMSDFATAIDDNPGIAQTANRNNTLGNLGTPGTILLRNRATLAHRPSPPPASIR